MFKLSSKLMVGFLALGLLALIGVDFWSGQRPPAGWERANSN